MLNKRILHTNPKNNWINFLGNNKWEWLGNKNAALDRQIETTRLLLKAYAQRRPGAILADDVGLGKTWIGILLAIAFASAEGKVIIAAPNRNVQKKWYAEFDRWYGDDPNKQLWRRSKKNDWIQLHPGSEIGWGTKGDGADDYKNLLKRRVLIVTHHQFWERSEWFCDLLIMDEAHRNQVKMRKTLVKKVKKASFTLFLTATPFGKDPSYFMTMLRAIGYSGCESENKNVNMETYLKEIKEQAPDPEVVNQKTAKAVYEELKPWIIRHTIDNISRNEKKMIGEQCYILGSFKSISEKEMTSTSSSLLDAGAIPLPKSEEGDRIRKRILCMERLKKLDKENRLKIRSQQVLTASYSTHAVERIIRNEEAFLNRAIAYHIKELKNLIKGKDTPMEEALFEFSGQCFEAGEKFIVFCHYHDTAKNVTEILNKASKLKQIRLVDIDKEFENAWKRIEKRGEENSRYAPLGTLIKYKDQIKKMLVLPEGVTTNSQTYEKVIEDLLRYGRVLKNLGNEDEQKSAKSPFGYVERLKANGRSNIARILFNTPFNPQALVITGKDSEGIDLHENCRILVHYELTYRPETVIQANGRIRRIDCLGAKSKKPILYYYPYLQGTRSEKLTKVVLKRVERFRKLMGGIPVLNLDQLNGQNDQDSIQNILENDFSNKRYKMTLD